MYNVQDIKTELLPLIGWRQNIDPNGVQIVPIVDNEGTPEEVTVDLATSEVDLWFNDAHPLLTMDDLYSIAPNFDQLHKDELDEVVKKDLINASFTAWLRQKTEASILKCLGEWYREKSELGTSKNLIERNRLFESTGNLTDTIEKEDLVVGLEISPTKSKSMVLDIKRIGVQCEQNETFLIYLFQTGSKTPLFSESIEYTGNGSVQWFDTKDFTNNWRLKADGVYYLAYDQSALLGSAINGAKNYGKGQSGFTTFPKGKYYKVSAFNVDIINIGQLWDLNDTQYNNDTNYGLNLEVSVTCDYSQFIIEQKELFTGLILYHVALDFLNEMYYNANARINRNAANVSKPQLLFDINGDSQGKDDFSIFGKYKKALKAIQFDSTGIDGVCLPCRRKGIRYKPVGAWR